MRFLHLLAAVLALAACSASDEQTAEARARAQRVVPSYQAPVYPLATNCLASTAFTYTCQAN